jgi:protein ImuA
MLSLVPHRGHRRPEVVEELRRLMARSGAVETRPLPFGLPALDAHLPQGGLTCGALHEVIPDTPADLASAFGFVIAMLGRTPRNAPVLFVTTPRALAGRLHGHGLNSLGLDPARVILVETADAKQALWAMEEALRSGVPAAVAGAVDRLDFRASQRLHLAAGDSGRPLLLLRPGGLTSVAVTRWRVAAASAVPDRFGLAARWRWRVTLERCRNGRPGQWLVEFDHATHRFSLAAALADPAVSQNPLPTLPRLRGRERVGARAG